MPHKQETIERFQIKKKKKKVEGERRLSDEPWEMEVNLPWYSFLDNAKTSPQSQQRKLNTAAFDWARGGNKTTNKQREGRKNVTGLFVIVTPASPLSTPFPP